MNTLEKKYTPNLKNFIITDVLPLKKNHICAACRKHCGAGDRLVEVYRNEIKKVFCSVKCWLPVDK